MQVPLWEVSTTCILESEGNPFILTSPAKCNLQGQFSSRSYQLGVVSESYSGSFAKNANKKAILSTKCSHLASCEVAKV